MRTTVAALAALAALASPATAEEVEHPAYKSWARHPIGTYVTIRSVTTSLGSALTTTTTYKLLELKADKAVLQVRKVSDATGTTVESPTSSYDQQRMFPLFPGVKKEDVGKPANASMQGEETLKLAGREIKTVWYDTKGRGDAGETLTRTWLSEEVPGRLVKAVTRIPKASTVVTLELTEFKTP
jgi:hypothetical protein